MNAGSRCAVVLLAAALACSALPAAAAVMAAQHFPAVKTAAPPPLDAALTDPVWQTALKAEEFANFTTQTPARLATTALLLYDDKNIYVGFICDQRGVPITATQTVNDVGAGLDDAVGIAFDTSGANSRTYTFTVTPRGVRYESSSESARYNPPWQAVTLRTDAGYNAMMVIPLADLRIQSAAAQSWRVNFTRRVAATNDLYTWAYDPASNAYCNNNSVAAGAYCDSTRWPEVTDMRIAGASARPKPYADIYGLGSTGTQRNVFETTPGNFTTQNPRTVGLDVTVPFTSSLAFVGALGPDFSNVEADQTTIAPQEFARNFQEFRPFFAQGAQYLDALPNLNVNGPGNKIVYTPSIGIFDSGYKLEGTAGRNSIGALSVHGDGFNDQVFGYGNARPDGSLFVAAEGVFAHHAGVIDDTIGIGGGFQNLVSGLQPLFLLEQETGTLVTDARQARTITAGAIVQHGAWLYGALWRDIGPEFAPVDGFNRINDIRGPQGVAVYNGVGGKTSPVKSYSFVIVGDRFLDRSGATHQADLTGGASVVLKNLLSFGLNTGASELRTYGTAFPVYAQPQDNVFNQTSVNAGYKDGTPSPTDASYAFGRFGVFCPGGDPQPLSCGAAGGVFAPAYVQQLDISATRTLGHGYGLTAEYAGTLEHGVAAPSDSQWLRRLSITRAFGNEGQLAVGLRGINGSGGFALPGTNLAISYHQRFHNASNLYFEYGTPAAFSTLHRAIVKYVFHVGGGAGT